MPNRFFYIFVPINIGFILQCKYALNYVVR